MSEEAPLMLSVSGLRGLVGSSLTPVVAARYGAAVGSWFVGKRGKAHPHVVVGRDSRPSGSMVDGAVIAGLISVGCRVTRLGIVTTPSVAIMVDELGADGGLVITASHNPIEWNGIKTLRHDGVAPPPDEAAEIVERFKADRFDYVGVEGLGEADEDNRTNRLHVDRVLGQVDVEAIRKSGKRVVLDSVCGAGGPAAAMLLKELGVEVVHLHGETTGFFPHTPEPTEANLKGLCQAVREHGGDVGFAQDPDADRLAIVDDNGRYIGEEYTLALAALRVFGMRRGAAVANLSTSRMIDDIAARFGCEVKRSAVGEANVAALMRETGAVIGGEGNGGVILPEVIHVRDSLVAIALTLDLLAAEKRTLSEVVADIPSYSIVKHKLPIREGMADRVGVLLRERFADAMIDLQDGVRIDWEDRWVHVRASNTEPILRVISEAMSREAADASIKQVVDAIDEG